MIWCSRCFFGWKVWDFCFRRSKVCWRWLTSVELRANCWNAKRGRFSTWKIFGKGLGCPLQDPDMGGLSRIHLLHVKKWWYWDVLGKLPVMYSFSLGGIQLMLIQGPLCWITPQCRLSYIAGIARLDWLVCFEVLHRWRGQSVPQIRQGHGEKLLKNCLLSFSQYGRTLLKKMSCSKKGQLFFLKSQHGGTSEIKLKQVVHLRTTLMQQLGPAKWSETGGIAEAFCLRSWWI